MGLRDKWKNAGDSAGTALGRLGKVISHTTRELLSDEERPEGEETLRSDWKGTIESIKNAGRSIGSAGGETGKKIKEKKKKADAKKKKKSKPKQIAKK